jgi:hypothetical protein
VNASRSAIIAYLAGGITGYPFDPQIDEPFVDELLSDFYDIDILEQLKLLRWYYDNRPLAGARSPRLAVRRWLARARRED